MRFIYAYICILRLYTFLIFTLYTYIYINAYQCLSMCVGMYSFIPDSGFVGTSFVHSLANTLTHVVSGLRLRVMPSAESAAAMGASVRE